MSGALFTFPFATPLYQGSPEPGSKLHFYLTNTTTESPVYTDADLGTEHANPVVADSAGKFEPIWLDPAVTYRVKWVDSADVLLDQADDVASDPSEIAILDARDYGYVADDSTDNASALADAIDAADALGGAIIQLPPGIGRISSKVVLDVANVEIRGHRWSTALRATAASFNMLEIRGAKCTVSGVAFYGAASDASTSQYGIETNITYAPSRLLIRDCYFGGDSAGARINNGILIDSNCNYARVENNIFETPWGATSGKGYGVLIAASRACIVAHNQFFYTTDKGRHSVYLSSGCAYCQVHHNYSEYATHEHITINANAGNTSLHNHISHNTLVSGNPSNSSTGAISVWGDSRGTLISNNTLDSPGQKGIIIQARDNLNADANSYDNVIQGNHIYNAGLQGIDIQGSTRTVVRGNFIRDSSALSANTSSHIRLVATASSGQAVTDATVEDNVCHGTAVNSSIELNSTTPTPTGTVILNNRLATGAGASAKINDNSGAIAWEGFKGGLATIPSGSTSVTVTHKLGVTPAAYQITLTPNELSTTDHGYLYVSSITSTQFNINCVTNPGASNLDVVWRYHPIV